MKKLSITIELTESTFGDLSDIAKAHHTTVAEIVRQRLETCSDDHLDMLASFTSELNAYRSEIGEQLTALEERGWALDSMLATLQMFTVPPLANNA